MESSPETHDLGAFLSFLYEGLQGYTYVATKNPNNPLEWGQKFFQYPSERSQMEAVIRQDSASLEVYVSPAVYSAPSATKEHFRASNVVWTEFDGNAPDHDLYTHAPSLIIRSSGPDNQHVYWRLTQPIYDVTLLEAINRNITYSLSADSSAWDATQVLRPPATFNHKRGAEVTVLADAHTSYDISVFDVLPEAPEALDLSDWTLGTLPDAQDVVLKYPFPPDMVLLLKKEKHDVKDRSASLMNLAYGCAEMGMTDAEIFVILRLADDRWEKFKNRTDRNKRLAHIITVARHKHPADENGPEDDYILAFNFVDFLNTDIQIDWLIDGLLMENGSMLLVGPSGIGKTQISLRILMHLAMGKDYWHYKIDQPKKVLFLSLEMGHGELKRFIEEMAKTLTPEELRLLQQNFIIVPHGEKWALNTPVGQEKLTALIEDVQPDGIFIDSVGAAIRGNISSDEDVFPLIDFNYHIRKKYNLFLWYIHHMRKQQNGGATATTQDDIYGNQYLLNSSTSAYGVLRGRDGLIKIRNFKNRLAEVEEDFLVKRVDHLEFEKVFKAVDEGLTHIQYTKPEAEKGPEPMAGNFKL